jgi:REP element-mobilizing transposase RayT
LPGRDVLPKHLYFSKISPKQWTIWNIVKLFKWYTTKKINRLWDKTHIYFSWQANYYDRIIRDEEGLQRIRKYIVENPLKWEFDKNNAEDLFM